MSVANNRYGAARRFGSRDAFDFQAFAADRGGMTICKPKAGAVIYAQGDLADGLYYINDGQVRIKVVSPQGKAAIMATLDADSFFGETCLLGENTRVATVACLTDCVLTRLTKSDAIRALQSDPRFAEFLLIRTMRRLRRLRARLVSHLFETGEQRLARILLILANHGTNRDDVIIPRLDQEELAQMVGTTRARISYFMNKFRDLGYIDYNGNIAVRRSLSSVLVPDLSNAEDAIESA